MYFFDIDTPVYFSIWGLSHHSLPPLSSTAIGYEDETAFIMCNIQFPKQILNVRYQLLSTSKGFDVINQLLVEIFEKRA